MNSEERDKIEVRKLGKMYYFRDRLTKEIYAINPYSIIIFERNLGILEQDKVRIVFFLFGQKFEFNRIVHFDEYIINSDDYYEHELKSIVIEVQRHIFKETLKHFDKEQKGSNVNEPRM